MAPQVALGIQVAELAQVLRIREDVPLSFANQTFDPTPAWLFHTIQ
jgi:hypothetical protein